MLLLNTKENNKRTLYSFSDCNIIFHHIVIIFINLFSSYTHIHQIDLWQKDKQLLLKKCSSTLLLEEKKIAHKLHLDISLFKFIIIMFQRKKNKFLNNVAPTICTFKI
jgi:hypothetical protein